MLIGTSRWQGAPAAAASMQWAATPHCTVLRKDFMRPSATTITWSSGVSASPGLPNTPVNTRSICMQCARSQPLARHASVNQRLGAAAPALGGTTALEGLHEASRTAVWGWRACTAGTTHAASLHGDVRTQLMHPMFVGYIRVATCN
jgi:hypothetical protein